MKKKIKELLWEYFLSGVRNGLAMQRLSPLVEGYIPWSSSALSATALESILNEIVVNERAKIVECGGGISTVYMASLIDSQNREGHIYTVENNSEWMEIIEELLDDRGLKSNVTLIHAPLRREDVSWSGEKWYSIKKVRSATPDFDIDLVVVDGPPAHESKTSHSRYPAVPVFKEFLADRYSVVLDDINRQAEKEILRAWESSLGITFERRFLDGNFAIGTHGEAFTV